MEIHILILIPFKTRNIGKNKHAIRIFKRDFPGLFRIRDFFKFRNTIPAKIIHKVHTY